MSTHSSAHLASRLGEGPLEALLAVAGRQSGRCYICGWIIQNQGARTHLLNPLIMGGVSVSPEMQERHLLSHEGSEL